MPLHGLLGIVCAKRTGRAVCLWSRLGAGRAYRGSLRRSFAEKKTTPCCTTQADSRQGDALHLVATRLARLPGAIRERETAVLGALHQLVRGEASGADFAATTLHDPCGPSKYNRRASRSERAAETQDLQGKFGGSGRDDGAASQKTKGSEASNLTLQSRG